MSYKEQIPSRKVFLVKFEEHRHRCEARDCTFNFSYKYLLIFQRTATRFNRQMYGKMPENLNRGFSSEAISLKCDQQILISMGQ